MEQSVLLSKKQYYSSVKEILQTKDYSDEISKEVEKYKKDLEEKYEITRQAEINQCNIYLNFIEECLAEIKEVKSKEPELVQEEQVL